MMRDGYVKGQNWQMVLLVIGLTALLIAVGGRMVWQAHKVKIARNRIHREIMARKRLSKERDELMRRVSELKSINRLERRAKSMGLALPDQDRVIFVNRKDEEEQE